MSMKDVGALICKTLFALIGHPPRLPQVEDLESFEALR
ncbi:hypothetical protein SLEP1_g26068 [Rubroshorea leprosula]|uniref:Uncharacterized protein n=1 Tax=Rubroshorea leprosula TaxID=152421 RepID=A0AAV5JS71_9ROSI|nr:hypothetical protein SLEP1_g26068 [Rubroshorea leprosula]